eukprot:1852447-Alexandrium_andersonii.AAC.1
MLEECGCAAGCLKRSWARSGRPSAGTRRSEDCRCRCESMPRVAQDARTLQADERINEHLANRLSEERRRATCGPRT